MWPLLGQERNGFNQQKAPAGLLALLDKSHKGSGRSWGGEINFLHSSVQRRCSRGCTVSDSFCGHLFNAETIMCCIAHSGILFSNSIPLVPRNVNNEAFSREVEMLPETCCRGRTCCWLMLWVILGIRGHNWLELFLTPKIKSKAFL